MAIFSTCYVNYNEPGIGLDLIAILEHNEIPYTIVEKEACCGMPKLELGDFDAVEKLKAINMPRLAALARDGYAILTAGAVVHADVQAASCRCCSRGRPDVRAVAEAMFDPFEYLVLRDTGRPAETRVQDRPLGKVSYHIPCHSRVQNVGQKTREVLEWVPANDRRRRSSVAPATMEPGASRASSTRHR